MADRLSMVFDMLSLFTRYCWGSLHHGVNRPNIACVQASAFTPFGAQPEHQQYSAEIRASIARLDEHRNGELSRSLIINQCLKAGLKVRKV